MRTAAACATSLLAVSLVGACGRIAPSDDRDQVVLVSGAAAAATAPPAPPAVPADHETAVYFARTAQDELQLVSIGLDDGSLTTVRTLPYPASRVTRAQAWGAGALVRYGLRGAAPPSTEEELDSFESGSGTVLVRAVVSHEQISSSARGSLAWIEVGNRGFVEGVPPVNEVHAVRSDGVELVRWTAGIDAPPAPQLRNLADDRVVYQRGRALYVQIAGDEHESYAGDADPLYGPIEALFETSLVARDGDVLRWFDFEGRALAVPGFLGRPEQTRVGFQVDDAGFLTRLLDRRVDALQQLDSTLGRVLDARAPGSAIPLAWMDEAHERWRLVGANGQVLARYAPEPDDGCSGALAFPLHGLDQPALEGDVVLIAAEVHHLCPGTTASTSYDGWRFDARTGQSSVRRVVDHVADKWAYRLSAKGGFLSRVTEAGALETTDVSSGQVRTFDVPVTVLPWAVDPPWAQPPF